MSRVGKISIARPGSPLQLEFDEAQLKDVLENQASPGDHVTLYPGDYTTDWDEAEPIEIRQGISVTILPGATMRYFGELGGSPTESQQSLTQNPRETYRDKNFTHDKPRPTDSTDDQGNPDHPLATGAAERYVQPNFVGHVENIVDMNFGSEWAFESDVEELRTNFEDLRDKVGNFVFETKSPSDQTSAVVGFEGPVEFTSDSNINISISKLNQNDPNNPLGAQIDFQISQLDDTVTSVSAGNKLQMENSQTFGDVEVQHEVIDTLGDVQNTGLDFIQSLEVDDGHVVDVDANPIARIEDRQPRSSEGNDGDVWLVEEVGFVRNIYLSTRQPQPTDGVSGPPPGDTAAEGPGTGDLWLVNDSINTVGKAGTVIVNEDEPDPGDGDVGDFWLELGEPGVDESFEIQNVFFKQRSPNSVDGNDEDIWTTEFDQ